MVTHLMFNCAHVRFAHSFRFMHRWVLYLGDVAALRWMVPDFHFSRWCPVGRAHRSRFAGRSIPFLARACLLLLVGDIVIAWSQSGLERMNFDWSCQFGLSLVTPEWLLQPVAPLLRCANGCLDMRAWWWTLGMHRLRGCISAPLPADVPSVVRGFCTCTLTAATVGIPAPGSADEQIPLCTSSDTFLFAGCACCGPFLHRCALLFRV